MKEFFESLLEEKAPGPYASFSVFHVMKAIELIARTGPIGRSKLSDGLETGVGVTRTIIERLRSAELISISKRGCLLTDRGSRAWHKLQSQLPRMFELDKNELTLAEFNYVVQVNGGANKVRAGLEQRDAAIIAGAKGATTLVFKEHKLFLPAVSDDIAKDFPIVFRQISRRLNLNENDAVVIGSADTQKKAEYGALAAAWTLIDNNGV